jgi:hypothetical protein
MVLTKEQKSIHNRRFYTKHTEKLRENSRVKQLARYAEDAEYKRIKKMMSIEKSYALNAIIFIRKLYIEK